MGKITGIYDEIVALPFNYAQPKRFKLKSSLFIFQTHIRYIQKSLGGQPNGLIFIVVLQSWRMMQLKTAGVNKSTYANMPSLQLVCYCLCETVIAVKMTLLLISLYYLGIL